jgi:oligopeptide/dipeptide ABC transporter ATP-binding protein
MKIRSQIAEGMIYHGLSTRSQARKKALELLNLVGIPDVALRAEQYPHELSGGQRQRVAIAIALSCNPRLLIADEPTTALDVTIQAQILRLIQQIQKQLQMSLILISHDLGVVGEVCDRILVFYAGKIVEQGKVKDIFESPRHPYTQMLLKSRPTLDHPKSEPLRIIEGITPSLTRLSSGCAFSERCPYKTKECEMEPPFFGTAACWRNRGLQ